MNVSPSALLAHARSDEGRKQLRYVGVSVVFVPLGQVFVQIFGSFMTFTAATLLTSAILTLPNFFANKHFVWRVDSKDNLRTQVLVFWVAVMLGVSLATLFTHLIENATADQTNLVRGAAVCFAQLLGYGLVLVSRFLILDRWLFKLAGDTPEHADEVIGEIPT